MSKDRDSKESMTLGEDSGVPFGQRVLPGVAGAKLADSNFYRRHFGKKVLDEAARSGQDIIAVQTSDGPRALFGPDLRKLLIKGAVAGAVGFTGILIYNHREQIFKAADGFEQKHHFSKSLRERAVMIIKRIPIINK